MPLDLKQILNRRINQKEETPELDRSVTLRPTDASIVLHSPSGRRYVEGSCLRGIWYRLNKIPPTNPPTERMPWIWWIGREWENKCQQLMREEDILSMENPRFVVDMGTYLLHGEMDGIGIDEDKKFFVVEFKNTGGYYSKMNLLGSSKKYKAKPKIENLMQTLLYLDRGPESLDYGILFYLIRDDMQIAQFYVRLEEHNGKKYPRVNNSPDLDNGDLLTNYPLDALYQRYEELINHFNEGVAPQRDYALVYSDQELHSRLADGELSKTQVDGHLSGKKLCGDWVCWYCGHKDYCYQQPE